MPQEPFHEDSIMHYGGVWLGHPKQLKINAWKMKFLLKSGFRRGKLMRMRIHQLLAFYFLVTTVSHHLRLLRAHTSISPSSPSNNDRIAPNKQSFFFLSIRISFWMKMPKKILVLQDSRIWSLNSRRSIFKTYNLNSFLSKRIIQDKSLSFRKKGVGDTARV